MSVPRPPRFVIMLGPRTYVSAVEPSGKLATVGSISKALHFDTKASAESFVLKHLTRGETVLVLAV